MKWMILAATATVMIAAIASPRSLVAVPADERPSGLNVQVMKLDPAFNSPDVPSIPPSWRCVGVGESSGWQTLWFQDPRGNCYGIRVGYDQGTYFIRSPAVAKLEAK